MITRTDNLPELRKGWAWTALNQACEIILGQSPPSSTYNENGDGLPFYQGKLEFGPFYPTPRKWCTGPKKIAENGDVLISVRAPVGPTNICPSRSCIGRGLAAIRGLGGIPTLFILYLMRAFEPKLTGQGTGTTFKAITGSQLKGFPMPLPPLAEQERIVAKIEELFTKLDAGVEALKKIKAQLKRYRQAVLKKFLSNDSWRDIELGKISEITSSKRIFRKDYVESGIPFYRTKEIVELSERKNISTFLYISNDKYSLIKDNCDVPKKGDILISAVGTIGITYVIPDDKPFYFKDGNLLWIKNLTKLSPVFLDYVLKNYVNTKIKGMTSGSAYNALTIIKLKQLAVPDCSYEEQRKVVEEIERHFSVADQIEQTIEQGLKQSDRLRQSILKKAFEGKLVPQDPEDEPAEKLVERIKAEKARLQADGDSKRKKAAKARKTN